MYKRVHLFKFGSVIKALQNCAEHSKLAAEAKSLSLQLKSFDVVLILEVLIRVCPEGFLHPVNIFSKQFQFPTLDIEKCLKLVTATY